MSLPTYGSTATLKASAANGASSAVCRVTSSPPGLTPVTGGTSSGDGRKSTMASMSGCTPLFLKAEPQSTGVMLMSSVAWRMTSRRCSGVISSPSR